MPIVTTLAEKFHDSFDGYYAGKKTGWTVQKSAQWPQAAGQKPEQKQQEERAREEAASRH